MKIKKNKSIYRQIWSITFGMLLFFMFLLFLLNNIYINRSKEKFISYQLNEILNEKIKVDSQKNEEISTFFSGVQLMVLSYQNNSYYLTREERSEHRDKKLLYSDEMSTTETLLVDELQKLSIINYLYNEDSSIKPNTSDHGHFSHKSLTYYYKVIAGLDPLSNRPILFIAYTINEREKGLFIAYLIAFALSLLISVWISRMVARRFSHSLSELEAFAGEIAKHHWETAPPSSTTLEIQKLSSSLAQMRDLLKETDEREKEFIQSGSHNLKTPVMVIRSYAQAILDGMLQDSEPQAAQVILHEAENMQRKITQMLHMLTYQNLNDSSESKEIIRIDRLLHHVLSKFHMIKPTLSWNEELFPIEIVGHSESLIVAFENLFENQLRYTKSTISVQLQRDPLIEQQLLMIIRNDGPPFSEKNPEVLFEKFKKDASGHWGLGLYIVRQIILAHEGTIKAYNNITNDDNFLGVRFEIRLPIPTQHETQSDDHFEDSL